MMNLIAVVGLIFSIQTIITKSVLERKKHQKLKFMLISCSTLTAI
jgi:hypothetical protein